MILTDSDTYSLDKRICFFHWCEPEGETIIKGGLKDEKKFCKGEGSKGKE
jgi:hypothetical protein